MTQNQEARWFVGAGGYRLRCAIFRAEKPVGSVVLSPGRTEALDKYGEVIGELLGRGFTVLTHDWRGQGLSQRLLPKDPLKGHARGWRDFIVDYRVLLQVFPDADLPRPRIAMGHSMGGALTALALAEGAGEFDGALLSAPMFGVNLGILPFWAGRIIARAMVLAGRASALQGRGDDPLEGRFEGNPVTHDLARWTRNQASLKAYPELALDGPTWGWVDFALSASAALSRRAGRLRERNIPVWIRYAGEEKLANNAVTRRIARQAGILEDCLPVEGAMHEILMETDDKRAQFWQAFDDLVRQTGLAKAP